MPITATQKACQSVSQSSSVVFDRTGKPVGERDVDQSIGFGVTKNTYSAHSKFSENTQAEKVVDRTGKLVGKTAQMHRLGPYLMNRDKWLSQSISKNCHHELQAARAEEERQILREELWRQQMDFREVHNKVLQRWRNYENSKVLPSIRSQDESSSRKRTLLWKYQVDYKNCKMK